MALLEIVKWPAAVLDTPADPVTEFDDDLKKLVNNMFETMYAAPGVGLAAVQVGVPQRLFVMDCSGGKDPSQRVALINPEVLRVEGNQNGEEGCLSFPGIFTPVERSLRAIVRATTPVPQPRSRMYRAESIAMASRYSRIIISNRGCLPRASSRTISTSRVASSSWSVIR